MWRGEHINTTEDRAVLHVALRQPPGAELGGKDIEQSRHDRARPHARIRGRTRGRIRGSAGKPFELVINIGIGGSDLGPAMAVLALKQYTGGRRSWEFVSNVDGCHFAEVLKTADPETTLFIVSSKTFTTLETQTNAHTARAWLEASSVKASAAALRGGIHQQRAMDEFGVHPDTFRHVGLGRRPLLAVVLDRRVDRHCRRSENF